MFVERLKAILSNEPIFTNEILKTFDSASCYVLAYR